MLRVQVVSDDDDEKKAKRARDSLEGLAEYEAEQQKQQQLSRRRSSLDSNKVRFELIPTLPRMHAPAIAGHYPLMCAFNSYYSSCIAETQVAGTWLFDNVHGTGSCIS